MDILRVCQYMDLMGIQTWQLRHSAIGKQNLCFFPLLKDQLPCGGVFLKYQHNDFIKLKLLKAIFTVFKLEVADPPQSINDFSNLTLNLPLLIAMGHEAKQYAKELNVIETVDIDELLKDNSKKRLVWRDLKIILKLIKNLN